MDNMNMTQFRDKTLWVVFGGLLTLVGPFVVTGVLTSFQERATMPMLKQRIEWVRHAAAQVPCDNRIIPFGSLINQTVEWNMRIVHEQEANRHWYSDLLSSDKWNDIKTIPVPCEGK